MFDTVCSVSPGCSLHSMRTQILYQPTRMESHCCSSSRGHLIDGVTNDSSCPQLDGQSLTPVNIPPASRCTKSQPGLQPTRSHMTMQHLRLVPEALVTRPAESSMDPVLRSLRLTGVGLLAAWVLGGRAKISTTAAVSGASTLAASGYAAKMRSSRAPSSCASTAT